MSAPEPRDIMDQIKAQESGLKYACTEGANTLVSMIKTELDEQINEKYTCGNCGRNDSSYCNCCVASNGSYDDKPTEWIPIKKDMVNHPDHYKTETGLETIDVIEAFTHGLDGIEAVCTGNVIKYICRWKKKNGIEDLKKAEWYLQKLIRHIELVESKNKLEEKEII